MPDISTELLSIQEDSRGETVRDSVVSAIFKIFNLGISCVDDEPLYNSPHPAKSGGIYNSIQQEKTAVDTIQVTIPVNWSGIGEYYQTIVIPGATSLTKIDILAESELFEQMKYDGVCAIWFVNNDGVITVHTLNAPLSSEITVTCGLSEVIV